MQLCSPPLTHTQGCPLFSLSVHLEISLFSPLSLPHWFSQTTLFLSLSLWFVFLLASPREDIFIPIPPTLFVFAQAISLCLGRVQPRWPPPTRNKQNMDGSLPSSSFLCHSFLASHLNFSKRSLFLYLPGSLYHQLKLHQTLTPCTSVTVPSSLNFFSSVTMPRA